LQQDKPHQNELKTIKKENSVIWINKMNTLNKRLSNRYEILPQELKKKIRFFSSDMNGKGKKSKHSQT